jgi:hypothetical protein
LFKSSAVFEVDKTPRDAPERPTNYPIPARASRVSREKVERRNPAPVKGKQEKNRTKEEYLGGIEMDYKMPRAES